MSNNLMPKKISFQDYESKINSTRSGNNAAKVKAKFAKQASQANSHSFKKPSQGSQIRIVEQQAPENIHVGLTTPSQKDTNEDNAAVTFRNADNREDTAPNEINEGGAEGKSPDRQLNSHSQFQRFEASEINKLDLIFEKQPEEVQVKLRRLLLNYNAVMQYNKDEDKFEVDVILPFASNEEKELFVGQFLKHRSAIQQSLAESKHQSVPPQPPSHQLRAAGETSNHKANESSEDKGGYVEGQNVLSQSIREEQSQKALEEREQLNALPRKIDFMALSATFDSCLDKVLKKQRALKAKQQAPKDTQVHQSLNPNRSLTLSSQSDMVVEGEVGIPNSTEESAFHSPSRSPKVKESSEWVKPISPPVEDSAHSLSSPQQREPSFQRNFYESPIPTSKNQNEFSLSNTSSNQILIEDGTEPTDYDDPNDSNQIYTMPYSTVSQSQTYRSPHQQNSLSYNSAIHMIEEENEDEDLEQNHNFGSQSKEPITRLEQSQVSQSQQSHQQYLEDKKKELRKKLHSKELISPSQRIQTRGSPHQMHIRGSRANDSPYENSQILNSERKGSIRKRYSEFLKNNHNQLEKLYEKINKDIKKNSQKMNRLSNSMSSASQSNGSSLNSSLQHNQIIVIEDEYQGVDSGENDSEGQFFDEETKGEFIRQYERRIVMENQAMSSEDKVRYFKYLLKHAKGLYHSYIKGASIIGRRNNSAQKVHNSEEQG